jgi:hypothetical protein
MATALAQHAVAAESTECHFEHGAASLEPKAGSLLVLSIRLFLAVAATIHQEIVKYLKTSPFYAFLNR